MALECRTRASPASYPSVLHLESLFTSLNVIFLSHTGVWASLVHVFVQQVRVLVNNALKLYSQDKTGMVDFALESGGEYRDIWITRYDVHLLAGWSLKSSGTWWNIDQSECNSRRVPCAFFSLDNYLLDRRAGSTCSQCTSQKGSNVLGPCACRAYPRRAGTRHDCIHRAHLRLVSVADHECGDSALSKDEEQGRQ